MIWVLVSIWVLALALGPMLIGSLASILRNDPVMFTVRLPLRWTDLLPSLRPGYFRWVLPPLLVFEFTEIR